MTLNKELVDFFSEEIGKLDDYEIYPVFERFSKKDIFDCLLNELQSLSKRDYGGSESAWYLGRSFGDISEKYPAEAKVYYWLINDSVEKGILFNFLLGYWEMTDADPNILIELVNMTRDVMINNQKWTEEEIAIAIEAIATGYVDNQKITESNEEHINYFKEHFKLFKEFLLKTYPDSGGHRLISKHILC
jgi:hypothetical protein